SSKVVIITTICLIFGGGLLIFGVENYSFSPDMSAFDKFFHTLFQSVTSRTAGFNTLPIESMTAASAMIMIILMWIGASPGSTGGGIKTSTFAVVFLALINQIRGKEKIHIFKRQIPPENVHRAFLIVVSSILVLGIGCTILVWIEPDKQPLNLVFEAVSAIGTVGLSRNTSPYLGTGGKYLIILLMYIGRIGVLTFFLAFYKPGKELRYTLPQSPINVG
ncbi:MAG: potassium transporter TrkG, partial [Bacteroidota bacterium]